MQAETGNEGKKPESAKVFIVAMVLVSALAVAGGWLVGTQLNMAETPNLQKMENAKSEKDKKNSKDGKHGDDDENSKMTPGEVSVVNLEPILAALDNNDNVWLRLQLAVISKSDSDLDSPEIKARMESDIVALLKTLTLEQISGPSGLLHLKEDLLDRTRLTTDGKVDELMIMSIIAE